jgi:hypothetical protein
VSGEHGRRLGKGHWTPPTTPDDMLPHYRGFGRQGRWDTDGGSGWADPPKHRAEQGWPGMYEQVGEPSPTLKHAGNVIIVVGLVFVAIALWVFWRVLRGW